MYIIQYGAAVPAVPAWPARSGCGSKDHPNGVHPDRSKGKASGTGPEPNSDIAN